MYWIILSILSIMLVWLLYKAVLAVDASQEQEQKQEQKQKIRILRTRYVFGYFAASIILFILFSILYELEVSITGYREYELKFIFSLASSCLGLYLNGFQWRRKSTDHPFPNYFCVYPFILVGLSVFAVVAISVFLEKLDLDDDTLYFYFWAIPINVYLVHFVDNLTAIKT